MTRGSSPNNNIIQASWLICYLVTSWAILFPHTQTRKAQVLWGIQRDSYCKYLTGCDSWSNKGSKAQRRTCWIWPTDSTQPHWVCLPCVDNQLSSQRVRKHSSSCPELPVLPARPDGGWRAAGQNNCHLKGPARSCCFHSGEYSWKALILSHQ